MTLTVGIAITTLAIYPVKSLRGIALTEAAVGPRGLRGDRRWLVTDANGDFLTQRQLPAMAQISVSLTDHGIFLTAPEMRPCSVSEPDQRGPRCQVRVWQDVCDALAADEAAGAWLTEFLGQACRLVYMPDETCRPIPEDFRRDPREQVSFADGFPILMTSDASLAVLNHRLASRGQDPVPMNRFRPNIVVGGGEAFAEDDYTRVETDAIALRIAKPCERCQVVTTDQQTGERNPAREPLATLREFRMDAEGGALFGQNLVPEKIGVLRVGDILRVVR